MTDAATTPQRAGQLSRAAWSAWAKNPDRHGEQVMSLVRHLFDSADVAAHVWRWLPTRVRTVVDSSLPDGARDGGRLLCFLAGVHDIGKCSPPFAGQVPSLAARMSDEGLRINVLRPSREAPHGSVGQVVLQRWLERRFGFGRRVATTYGVVVGGHHGSPPGPRALQALGATPHLIGDGLWTKVQEELLDTVAERVGVTELLGAWSTTPLAATAQTVLSGAVIVSDWLASNVELFPLGSQGLPDRAAEAWHELGLPPSWRPSAPTAPVEDLIGRRFPALEEHPPRPVQRLTVEAARVCEEPSLLVVEAAMGSGKTEAALLAAEELAARHGCGGVYIALPTMATSDAMFGRVLDWVRHLDDGGTQSTYLAHGKANLNPAYNALRRPAPTSGIHDEDLGPTTADAQVYGWLAQRKTGVLASMVVGTIDQLLFTALQAKHLALRHLAFAGKVVVVDEAHAADDYMRSYLARTLEWLAAYGVPVVLMSATLPRSQRQVLADAYRLGRGAGPAKLPADQPYPAVTRVDAEDVTIHGAEDVEEPARTVQLRCLTDDADELVTTLREELQDGGCAAVIRNTVARAQDAAQLLRHELPGTEIVLAHSRFVATHRAQREADLRVRLGRDPSQRPERLVVVGTQVLEQSLDVDFDVMVTDLAPVDLVLQRVGRLHRHERGEGESDRPPRLREPRVYVTGIEKWDADGLPTPARVLKRIYSLSRLLRSAAVLGLVPQEITPIELPSQIRPLVEAAYASEVPGPATWRDTIAAADDLHAAHVATQLAKSVAFQIRPVAATESLRGWLEGAGGTEADDLRNPGASRVRDSEDGLEVIVVQRDADGEVVCLRDGGPCAGKAATRYLGPPEPDVQRALAATTVRLPFAMTHEGVIDDVIDALEAGAHEGWQQSSWLQGRLALQLDDDWRAEVAGFEVTYDLEEGLRVRSDSSPRRH